MKTETRSFYEAAVERTALQIARSLDQVLDLTALARGAALSPFHFHRIFRGMLGETPLEMHRRLRLERAAWQLVNTDLAVTRLAFEAGYETHEAFTRAFRHAYGVSPSTFRRPMTNASGQDCLRPRQAELAARSGVHFHEPQTDNITVHFTWEEYAMNVTIETLPELRVATVHHVGPYQRISEAFARLGELAAKTGLLPASSETAMLAIYYDDPETTPADKLHSDAGLTVPNGAPLPDGLLEKRLPAGRYARTTHVGPYTKLGDAWSRLMGEWLPKSGHRVGEGSSFEIYRNTPGDTAPSELRTDLYLPVT